MSPGFRGGSLLHCSEGARPRRRHNFLGSVGLPRPAPTPIVSGGFQPGAIGKNISVRLFRTLLQGSHIDVTATCRKSLILVILKDMQQFLASLWP